MSSPPRVQGSVLVVAVVTLTLTAVGYGTVYLPFYSDKERLRGLRSDERKIPDAAKRELLDHIEKEAAYRKEWESQLAPPIAATTATPKKTEPKAVEKQPRSMWGVLDFKKKQQKPSPQQAQQDTTVDENKPLWKIFEEQQQKIQEEDDSSEGSSPAYRPDRMRLSERARNQIIETLKASEEEDRRQEQLQASRKSK